MQLERAETVALNALNWLLSNDDLRPLFLNASGADEAALRSAANDPSQSVAVLDFLAMEDSWIIEFCDSLGLEYTEPLRARSVLSGDSDMHWT